MDPWDVWKIYLYMDGPMVDFNDFHVDILYLADPWMVDVFLSCWWLNQPLWKLCCYARQNGFIFPKFRGENKDYLKPPPGYGFQSFDVGKSSAPQI